MKHELTDDIKRAIERAATDAAPAFEANAWRYGGLLGSEGRVPDKGELAMLLTELAEGMLEDNDKECRTGRFSIRRAKRWDEERLVISLDLAEVSLPKPLDCASRQLALSADEIEAMSDDCRWTCAGCALMGHSMDFLEMTGGRRLCMCCTVREYNEVPAVARRLYAPYEGEDGAG